MKRNSVVGFCLCLVVGLSLFSGYVIGQGASPSFSDYYLDQSVAPYSYMICTDGLGWYWAVNGSNGAVCLTSTNATELINQITALSTSNNLITIQGTDTPIYLGGGSIILNSGSMLKDITLVGLASQTVPVVRNSNQTNGNSQIKLSNVVINASNANNTALDLYGTSYSPADSQLGMYAFQYVLRDVTLYNGTDKAVRLRGHIDSDHLTVLGFKGNYIVDTYLDLSIMSNTVIEGFQYGTCWSVSGQDNNINGVKLYQGGRLVTWAGSLYITAKITDFSNVQLWGCQRGGVLLQNCYGVTFNGLSIYGVGEYTSMTNNTAVYVNMINADNCTFSNINFQKHATSDTYMGAYGFQEDANCAANQIASPVQVWAGTAWATLYNHTDTALNATIPTTVVFNGRATAT